MKETKILRIEGVRKILELVQSMDKYHKGKFPRGYYAMHGFLSAIADKNEMPEYLEREKEDL